LCSTPLTVSNDAVVRLDETYPGCSWNVDGLCPVSQAVDGINERLSEIDYSYACRMSIVSLTVTDLQTATGRTPRPLETLTVSPCKFPDHQPNQTGSHPAAFDKG
jgi:hypothetical protein